jgi:hypothetical protein
MCADLSSSGLERSRLTHLHLVDTYSVLLFAKLYSRQVNAARIAARGSSFVVTAQQYSLIVLA